MSDEWFVERTTGVAGPYTAAKLKALAAQGRITSGDFIRKGTDGKAVPASKVKGLFEVADEARPSFASPPPLPSKAPHEVASQPVPQPMPQEGKTPEGAEVRSEVLLTTVSVNAEDTARKRLIDTAKSIGTRIRTDSKAAAQVAAKQAERAKIVQFTLPNAYSRLGKAVHSAQKYRQEFADIYADIDGNLEKANALKHVEASSSTRTLAEGAKSTAARLRNSVAAKALDAKVTSQMRTLGEAAYKKDGQSSGPTELTSAIAETEKRIARLDAEIAEIEQAYAGRVFTPIRIATIGVCAIVLCLMAYLFFPSHTKERQSVSRDFSRTTLPPSHSNPVLPQNTTVPKEVHDLSSGLGRLERSVLRMSSQRSAESTEQASRRATYAAEQRRKAEESKRDQDRMDTSRRRKTLVAQKEHYLDQIREQQRLSKKALANLTDPNSTSDAKIARFPMLSRVPSPILAVSTPVREWQSGWDNISRLHFSPDGTALFVVGEGVDSSSGLVRFPSFDRIVCSDNFIARGDDFPYFRAIDEESGGSAGYNKSIRVSRFAASFRSRVASGDMLGRRVRFSPKGDLLAATNLPGWDFIGPSLPSLAFLRLNSGPIELLDLFAFRSMALSPKQNSIGDQNEKGQHISDAQFFHDSLICLSAVDWAFKEKEPNEIYLQNANFVHPSCTMLSVWKSNGVVGTMHTAVKVGSSFEPSYRFAVNAVNGHVALLYENGMRVVDATAIGAKQSPFRPLMEWMFDDPYLGRSSVFYTSDGRHLLLTESRTDKDAAKYHSGDYWRASVFDSDYKKIASTRMRGPNQVVKDVRQDGRAFLTVQAQPPDQGFLVRAWSLPDLKMICEVQTKWAGEARFFGQDKIVTGARSRTQTRLAGGDRMSTNVWDASTGRLVARITDRNVDCLNASPDGRYVVTGKERYLGKSAVLAVWDSSAGTQVPPDDEFADERRNFFSQLYRSGGPYAFVELLAPPVTLERFKGLDTGMKYDEVTRMLFGTGQFEPEVLEVDEAEYGFPLLLRFAVTYSGQGEKDAKCTLVFEGNAAKGTRGARLVKKTQEGLR